MSASVPVPADLRDRRDSPRFSVTRRARVLQGASGLATAVIHDISASGARVRLEKPEGVTDQIILVDLAEGVAYEATVAWRKLPEFGVRFARRHNLKGLVPAQLRLAKSLWQHEGDPPPPPPIAPVMPVSAEPPPPPPEPSESRKAAAALTQTWRARLLAGGLEPN
jgi:hypothetical protein